MSDTYTKLFRSITASTIVSEPLATRWLWVTMLSQADATGCVWGSVPGLARLANITREECEAALACFMSPDPDSRTQDHEGRRIEVIPRGWRLLNHAVYAAVRNADERAEYRRQWDREHRGSRPNAAHRPPTTPDNPRHNPTKPDAPDPTSTNTSTTTEQKPKQEHASSKDAADKRGARLPADWTPSAALVAHMAQKCPRVDQVAELESFRDHWTAKPGKDACKLDWDATYRNWIRTAAKRLPRDSGRPLSAPERVEANIRKNGGGHDELFGLEPLPALEGECRRV